MNRYVMSDSPKHNLHPEVLELIYTSVEPGEWVALAVEPNCVRIVATGADEAVARSAAARSGFHNPLVIRAPGEPK